MNSNSPTTGDDDIQIRDILVTLWNSRAITLIFTIGCTVAVAVAAYTVPKKYTAVTIVAPVSASTNNQAGVLGSLSNNLAAIAGVPATSDPKKVESIAILQSEALTERYIRTNNLLPILFAKQWDAARSAWKGSDKSTIPTIWKASEYFRKHVKTVSTDAKTGLVTLRIIWPDPAIAAKWANGLIELTNNYERETAITESENNIAYLTDQASKTDVVGIKQVIYSLLESEFSKAMLAKGNREYSFKVIDPAVIPEKASYPDMLIWVLTSLFASVSLAIFVSFCVVAWRKTSRA